MEAEITTIPQSPDVVLSVMDGMFCAPLILSHSNIALGPVLITLTFISIIIIKIILTWSIIIIQHTESSGQSGSQRRTLTDNNRMQ